MSDTKFISLPVFSTRKKMKAKVKGILFKEKSDFQEILIANLKEFGKCLILDGIMQCSEKDHEIYGREMLKKLKKTDKNILILGGGDGYVAEMALKLNPKLKIRLVELDIEVVKACEKILNGSIFKNKNVSLYIEDVFHFLKFTVHKVSGKVNGVVCDLTDAPIGRKKKKDFEKFYSDIIKFSFEHLRTGGWMSIQAGASKNTSHYIDAVGIIRKMLKKYFTKVERSDIFIPSYGESCAFLFGKKE